MTTLGQYGKGIAAAVGAAAVALQPHYGGQWWFALILAAEAAVGVIFVSNTPKGGS